MAIEQSFILQSNIGSTLVSLDEVTIVITDTSTLLSETYNTNDPEITVTDNLDNTWNINFSTLSVTSDNISGLITFEFTITGNKGIELCRKSSTFIPTSSECPTSLLGLNEEYASFKYFNLSEEDGKIIYESTEDCLVFVTI